MNTDNESDIEINTNTSESMNIEESNILEQFEEELYNLKKEFHELTMATPYSMEQDPLIAFILKEDLIRIGRALIDYIDGKGISIPATTVMNIYKEAAKPITTDVDKYKSNRQGLIKKMINRAIDIIDSYETFPPAMVKKEIINDIFYKYIWNIAPIENDEYPPNVDDSPPSLPQ